MPRRKPHYLEKPWKPDPTRWAKLLTRGGDLPKRDIPLQPSGGWQLWDWRTLKDVPQNERV